MADLKVNDSGTPKTPNRIFAKGNSGTLYQVNYVVVNNGGTPETAWNAISQTVFSTATTFATSQSTTTTFNTSQSTTTTFSTSNSTTTTFSTSKATTTTFATSKATTTTFATSKATTTTFATSKATTTTFNTSRTTSRTTANVYGSYTYVRAPTGFYWWRYSTNPNAVYDNVYWNAVSKNSGGFGVPKNSTLINSDDGYTYNRGPLQSSEPQPASKGIPAHVNYYYSLRRKITADKTTSFTTTYATSRSTTTTFNTSRSTTTTFNTSRSTTTTYNTSNSTTTTFDTSNATTTTFDTSNATDTTFATSNATTTTFDTSNATDTIAYERVTASGIETEVLSGEDHSTRYWDGSQWTEV